MSTFKPIQSIESPQELIAREPNFWVEKYKDVFTEHPHDTSQLTLVHPDDCLLVAGPTRLRHSEGNPDQFHVVGFANTLSYTETSNVQPLKALGSRRHIFAKTNMPVQIQIARMMILGLNTLKSIYRNVEVGADIYDRNSHYSHLDHASNSKSSWYSNVEEDIFRIPIGLGVLYNAPATLAGHMEYAAGAEYFEVCTVVSKSITLQSGQAMIMEQVTLMADRCIPWQGFAPNIQIEDEDGQQSRQVTTVAANI